MKNVTAHIIDDEVNSQAVLKKMLENYCPVVEIIDISSSIEEAVPKLKKNNVDAIFLDIEMPKSNGFKIFDFFKPNEFQVIFTTAYAQYALKAFEFAAVHYLVKPIDIKELIQAVSRLEAKTKIDTDQNVTVLLEHLNKKSTNIAIPINDGFVVKSFNDILYCVADDNYCLVVLHGEEKNIFSPRTLKKYESLLLEFGFFRCSRSHLININRIKRYNRKGNSSVVMADNQEIIISQSKRNEFLELFGNDI